MEANIEWFGPSYRNACLALLSTEMGTARAERHPPLAVIRCEFQVSSLELRQERPYDLVSSTVEQSLITVLREAQYTLFIASPYISEYGVDFVLNNTRARKLRLLTRLDIANLAGSGLDISALLKLWDKLPCVEVSSLCKLHAKVYVADDKTALLTSANLTRGGLRENYEYGVILRHDQMVPALLEDMNAYFGLGNIYDREAIVEMEPGIEEIRRLQRELEMTAESKGLRSALKKTEAILQEKLLANRVRGQTINDLFSRTIVYLLKANGAMSTADLHPSIQKIHPDICDDAIDRVIKGQHFGKRWKHLVRNAQQYLKKTGRIRRDAGKWYLVNDLLRRASGLQRVLQHLASPSEQ